MSLLNLISYLNYLNYLNYLKKKTLGTIENAKPVSNFDWAICIYNSDVFVKIRGKRPNWIFAIAFLQRSRPLALGLYGSGNT